MATSSVSHNIKWLSAVSVWLFLLMAAVLTSGKVSMLWLLRLYKYEQIHPATWYILICVMLVVPHVTNFIYIIWNTPFISSAHKKKMPRPGHIYMGILGGVMETVAVCFFASEISLVLPEPIFLFLPSAVFTIPLIVKAAHNMKMTTTRKSSSKRFVRILTQCLHVALCTYTFWAPALMSALIYLWSPFNMQIRHCVALPILLLVLSTAWTPRVQEIIVCSSGQRNWKATLAYNCLKIVAIPITLTGLMAFNLRAFREDMYQFMSVGFANTADYRVWLPLLVTIVTGMSALAIMNIASKVSLTTPGVWLPSLLAPLLTFGAATILWGDISTEAIWELSGMDLATWSATVLAFLVWIVPYIIPALNIIESPTALLRPFSENFFGFTWNAMFLEQSLILNYSHKGIGSRDKWVNTTVKQGKHKTVFVCTTMFRETRTEMKRYLNSLKKMVSSNVLNDVSVEAHVFLDNAIENGQYNSFACQLLNLLIEVFHLSYPDLNCYKTPYGFQFHCIYDQNFPVYVHVKNGELFKVKKRWSQVMYMNYVLKYRCGFNTSSPSGPKDNDLTSNGNFDTFITGLKHNGKEDYCTNLYKYFKEKDDVHKNSSHRHPSSSTDFDDSGSDTSTDASEAYTVSRESTASCFTSEGTDSDDSDLFSYKKLPPKTHTKVPCMKDVGNEMVKHVLKAELARRADKQDGGGHRVYLPPDLFYFQPGTGQPGRWRNNGLMAEEGTNETSLFTIAGNQGLSKQDDVYVLATDADTQFKAKSVRALLDLCDRDQSLGAACGRTVPTGGFNPVVWYQKFEYAKDFWLVKASQNIIGSVTCCPGCFSLYRGQALADVMSTFSEPSCSAFDALVKDHGEDRWLCTLMMMQGWKLEYIDNCRNSTHCPESFTEFLRQRRRWVLSELSNMVLIFQSLSELVRRNSAFSAIFILSLLQMFLWVLLSPSTTLIVLCVACEIIFGLPLIWSAPFAFLFIISYTVVCCTCSKRAQNIMTLTFLLSVATFMIAISAGFIAYMVINIQEDLAKGHVEFRPYFLVPLLIGGTIYAALIHPGEWLNLVYGIVYAFIFPAMFIILPIYAVSNMVDQSWGTREESTAGEYCCDKKQEKPAATEEETYQPLTMKASDTLPLTSATERRFWEKLRKSLLGTNVNCGKDEASLRHNLKTLRDKCVITMVIMNTVWYSFLTSVYLLANSDVICYVVAGVFSFSLVVQLVGLTSYKIDNSLRRHILRRAGPSHPLWVKDRH
ncbi:uncharacterized protein [Haliotis cracherodii]|uniref:uncharacterized protein n=1 Tax=Haliotis cracherodii TaxID=6455 RepID=UPI0039EB2D5C